MLGTLVLLAGVASAQFGYSQDELDLFDLVEEVGVQETLYIKIPAKIQGFRDFTDIFEKIPEILSVFLKTTPKVLYLRQVSEP